MDTRSPAGHWPPAPGGRSGRGGGERATAALACPPPAPPVTRRVFSTRGAPAWGPRGLDRLLGGKALAGPQGLQTATIPFKFGQVNRGAYGSFLWSRPSEYSLDGSHGLSLQIPHSQNSPSSLTPNGGSYLPFLPPFSPFLSLSRLV